jgi:hypothetical protein
MADYSAVKKEEQLKSLVRDDFFMQFGYEPDIDNIDFVISAKSERGASLFNDGAGTSAHYLWAEAKKGICDIYDMYTQLILTCRKTYADGVYLAPPWLGCFDQTRLSFVPFNDVLPVFSLIDFNWNTTPHDHTSLDFKKARRAVEKLIGAKVFIFNFSSDERDIRQFIQQNFIVGANAAVKSPITEANFVQIFYKWVKEVRPTINMTNEEWAEYKKADILECDFFRADIMSDNGNSITISDKLKIILEQDTYKLKDKTKFDRLLYIDIDFSDEGGAYRRFWNRYERPPAEIYHKFIIDRRDLLVPENIRERKGTFFTPRIWADTSKAYLEAAFGTNWQDEYYIWDCAAGSGNLLAGLKNPYNVFASDIDQANVETIKTMAMIDENLKLLDSHIFQFDFLNDILTEEDYAWKKGQAEEHGFDAPIWKIPPALRDIIGDSEKRKKLIVYINPPYAEASSYGHLGKPQLANQTNVFNTFSIYSGAQALNELFAQFLIRIYFSLPTAKISFFSTPKYITSTKFIKFRSSFTPEYKKGFTCMSNTFDNVEGKFPILFSIWDTEKKKNIRKIKSDVLIADKEMAKSYKKGSKIYVAADLSIADWRKKIYNGKSNTIGFLIVVGPSMQSNTNTFFTSSPAESYIKKKMTANITEKNILDMCIYLAVRQSILLTWLNNRDVFLHPNDGYKSDTEFHRNCLVFTLFHSQNRISARDGVNHWIPFTETEVGAKDTFQSHFMSAFLKERKLGAEAAAVLDAGRELWKYYHLTTKNIKPADVNASFYDIRSYFQGHNEKRKMNNTSNDELYSRLIAALREAQKNLAAKIAPKVYEYAFLKE